MQKPEKMNVWAGIQRNYVIGSFSIDGNMSGINYVALLQNSVMPTLTLCPVQSNSQVLANVMVPTG